MHTSELNDPTGSTASVNEPLAALDFSLYATLDQPSSLSEWKGAPVILAFYPADWSEVCCDQMSLYNELLSTQRSRPSLRVAAGSSGRLTPSCMRTSVGWDCRSLSASF
ncbi:MULTISPECIES: redoxin domain-containing protein [unclassified Pseudomonas]|uniref:redoxin domain-containing protein n=1 Tax=unclassified Pseudomonas TaxID=196821 RepID=UPI002113FC18|nr:MULTISPECIES: redoxin domain-containing protein [unclassified Pseudomonas]